LFSLARIRQNIQSLNFPYCDIAVTNGSIVLNSYYFTGSTPALQDAMVGYTRGSLYQNMLTKTLYLIENLSSIPDLLEHQEVIDCFKSILEADLVKIYKKRLNISKIRKDFQYRMIELVPPKFLQYLQTIIFKTGVTWFNAGYSS
jgi:hypothetical protein